MANLLNLNSGYSYMFTNLSMIAYIIAIQKSKFIYTYFSEINQSGPGCYIKLRLYFHPVG